MHIGIISKQFANFYITHYRFMAYKRSNANPGIEVMNKSVIGPVHFVATAPHRRKPSAGVRMEQITLS
jgi:hypothetical protein